MTEVEVMSAIDRISIGVRRSILLAATAVVLTVLLSAACQAAIFYVISRHDLAILLRRIDDIQPSVQANQQSVTVESDHMTLVREILTEQGHLKKKD